MEVPWSSLPPSHTPGPRRLGSETPLGVVAGRRDEGPISATLESAQVCRSHRKRPQTAAAGSAGERPAGRQARAGAHVSGGGGDLCPPRGTASDTQQRHVSRPAESPAQI